MMMGLLNGFGNGNQPMMGNTQGSAPMMGPLGQHPMFQDWGQFIQNGAYQAPDMQQFQQFARPYMPGGQGWNQFGGNSTMFGPLMAQRAAPGAAQNLHGILGNMYAGLQQQQQAKPAEEDEFKHVA